MVEDNPGDVRLTVEALKDAKVRNNVNVVEDGVEALRYLRNKAPFEDVPRPDIILLDLNLPRMDGRSVLAELKQDPRLRRIPVLILTTSEAEQDILKSYDLHANCYISKPVDLQSFLDVARSLEDFWFTIVRLPPDREARAA